MQISAFELLQTVAVKPRELCACVGLQTGVALQELPPPGCLKATSVKGVTESILFHDFDFIGVALCFVAPKLTGFTLKLFVWLVESPIFGPWILSALKEKNKFTQVWFFTVKNPYPIIHDMLLSVLCMGILDFCWMKFYYIRLNWSFWISFADAAEYCHSWNTHVSTWVSSSRFGYVFIWFETDGYLLASSVVND